MAADMVPLLKGSLRLSKYGQVQFDQRTNTLIIADLPEQFPAIRQLLTTLDRAESKRGSSRRRASLRAPSASSGASTAA